MHMQHLVHPMHSLCQRSVDMLMLFKWQLRQPNLSACLFHHKHAALPINAAGIAATTNVHTHDAWWQAHLQNNSCAPVLETHHNQTFEMACVTGL